jgi:hypothetical protein
MVRHRYQIFRSWTWEILSVILAIGLLVAITVLLVSFHGKPSPDWGARLNFNALLALLSTILRAMLVVTVSQIICQQKWDWYENEQARPLSDLQQFDSGSRGIFGALQLVPKVVLKDPVTLISAVVLVVSFLIGPFVQQASRTMPCTNPAADQKASIPYAHYVPRSNGFESGYPGNDGNPTPDTTVAILSSITAPGDVENQISPICSTGNCTFCDTDRKAASPKYLVGESSLHPTIGMCNTCIDVSSLVARQGNASAFDTLYTLPNGFNVSLKAGSAELAMIKPSPDLSWIGELLTPELRTMSRWAYVNATFIAINYPNNTAGLAAVCVLYPCLRTYTASITNDKLLEKEVTSEVMEIDVTNPAWLEYVPGLNARQNYYQHYAAVQNPCYVDGQVYNANGDTPPFLNATTLSLYDFSDPRQSTYRNISLPESCIYRHHAQFAMAISKVLHEEVFYGTCDSYKGPRCSKSGPSQLGTSTFLSDLGVGAVLRKLIDGELAYSNVTLWFDSFADAMTNRFRFQYGAGKFNSTDRNLPLGEVQGLAWRTETCISAHRDWLALPICLTAITTLLMLWTIVSNWRGRRTRPVWKDNILPLLYYRQKIASKKSGILPWQRNGLDSNDEDSVPAEKALLMEANEMNKISERTAVTFQWPSCAKLHGSIKSPDSSAIALHETSRLSTQRRSRDADAESLLETNDNQDHGPPSIDTDQL